MGTHESPKATPSKLHHEITTTTSRVLPMPLGRTTTRAISQGARYDESAFGERQRRRYRGARAGDASYVAN
mgnify:CR=1 FL=1